MVKTLLFHSNFTDNIGSTSGQHSTPHKNPTPHYATSQGSPLDEDEDSDPFCYYQETHVQESVNICQNNLIKKILFEKSIHVPTLYSSLVVIWCNPSRLKITEVEGKLLQISMDNAQDLSRVLKGNPRNIRNYWLLLHAWDRKVNPSG